MNTTVTASLTDAMHQIAQALDNEIVGAAAVTFARAGENQMIGVVAESITDLAQWQLFLDGGHRHEVNGVAGHKAGVFVNVRLETFEAASL